jgi:hypothetical protein
MMALIGASARVPKPRGQARRQVYGVRPALRMLSAYKYKGQTGLQSVRYTLNRGGRRFVNVLSSTQCWPS